MIDVNDVMWEGWPQHRGLRPLLFSNSGVGSFTSHKNQISVSKCCETGSTVFHPYPSIAERQCNRSQMSLQRQHFLLSYLKTLSVGPAGVRTRDLPLSRPALSQLSQPGGGWSVYSGKLTKIDKLSLLLDTHDGEFVVNLLLTCLLPARHLSPRYFFNCPFPSTFLNFHWGFHGNEAAIILVNPRHISGERESSIFPKWPHLPGTCHKTSLKLNKLPRPLSMHCVISKITC